MKIFLAAGCVAPGVFGHRARRATWSYGELGADWEADHCLKDHQSPIDIVSSDAEQKPAASFKYKTNHYATETEWKAKSNGHTLVYEPQCSEEKPCPSIESHALIEGTYELAQFHFHWGGANADEGGSEHTVDGKRYFSELHLVHYNTKYTNLTASLSHSDGLAVLGFFLDDSGTENSGVDDLIMDISQASYTNGEYVDAKAFSLHSVLNNPDAEGIFDEFWRYKGSLTTPPCNEVVQWTVVKKPITVTAETRARMLSFVDDSAGDDLVKNYREIQPLNDRTIKYYSNDVDGDDGHTHGEDGHEGHEEDKDTSAEPEPEKEPDAEGEPEGEEEPKGGIFAESNAMVNQISISLICIFITLLN